MPFGTIGNTGGGGGGDVSSVFGRIGDIIPQDDDYSALQIVYDAQGTTLNANDLQAVIDELDVKVEQNKTDLATVAQKKYPETHATTATSWNGNVVTQSSEIAGKNGFLAFDGLFVGNNVGWKCENGVYNSSNGLYIGAKSIHGISGEWLTIKLPSPITLNYYKLFNPDTQNNFCPKQYVLLGSSDSGSTWAILDDVRGSRELLSADFDPIRTPEFVITQAYNTFAIVITETFSTSGLGAVAIAELEFFGTIISETPTTISGLLDVNINTVTDNQIIKYNATSTMWENSDPSISDSISYNYQYSSDKGVSDVYLEWSAPDDSYKLTLGHQPSGKFNQAIVITEDMITVGDKITLKQVTDTATDTLSMTVNSFNHDIPVRTFLLVTLHGINRSFQSGNIIVHIQTNDVARLSNLLDVNVQTGVLNTSSVFFNASHISGTPGSYTWNPEIGHAPLFSQLTTTSALLPNEMNGHQALHFSETDYIQFELPHDDILLGTNGFSLCMVFKDLISSDPYRTLLTFMDQSDYLLFDSDAQPQNFKISTHLGGVLSFLYNGSYFPTTYDYSESINNPSVLIINYDNVTQTFTLSVNDVNHLTMNVSMNLVITNYLWLAGHDLVGFPSVDMKIGELLLWNRPITTQEQTSLFNTLIYNNRKYLCYDESSLKWIDAEIGVSNLTDTVIASPIDGQVLTYDGDKWKNVGIPTTTEFPTTLSTSDSWNGNTASASLVFGSAEAWNAFNGDYAIGWVAGAEVYDGNTGSYIGNVGHIITFEGILGEWLRIDFPVKFQITSFTIHNGNDVYTTRQYPREFVLFGSTDGGSSWNKLVDRRIGFDGEGPQSNSWESDNSFNIPVTTTLLCDKYVLVVTNVGDDGEVSRSSASIKDFKLYGKTDTITTPITISDLIDVNVDTPLDGQILQYNATSSMWENVNESNGEVSTDLRKYPTTLANASIWGSQNEVVASSEYGGNQFQSWKAFDGLVAGVHVGWISGGSGQYSLAGDHIGATSLNGIMGEWIQIKISDSIILETYRLYNPDDRDEYCPKEFVLLASVDSGSTWVILDDLRGARALPTIGFNSEFTPLVPITEKYDTFAIVVTKTFPDNTNGITSIAELEFYGYGAGALKLDDLIDAVIATPLDKQILQYNSSSTKWENTNAIVSELDDVDINTPLDKQILQYNTTSTKWENTIIPLQLPKNEVRYIYRTDTIATSLGIGECLLSAGDTLAMNRTSLDENIDIYLNNFIKVGDIVHFTSLTDRNIFLKFTIISIGDVNVNTLQIQPDIPTKIKFGTFNHLEEYRICFHPK